MKPLVVGLCSVLGFSCAKTYDVKVDLVTTACDATLDPLAGVTALQLRVNGPDFTQPMVDDEALSGGTLSIPAIPTGDKRVIEVRGYDKPASDLSRRVLSVGRSAPFDVGLDIAKGQLTKTITVVLRKVDSFSPPSAYATPTVCSQMRNERAGHSATLLSDGRVFIAGGFQLVDGKRVATDQAEFFEPATGDFRAAPSLVVVSTTPGSNQVTRTPQRVAFHAATLVRRGSSEQVLLFGGETYAPGGGIGPSAIVVVFDLLGNQDDPGPAYISSRQLLSARSEHVALVTSTNEVLLAGGVTKRATVLSNEPTVEWLHGDGTLVSVVDGESLPRVELAATNAGSDLNTMVVAGGTDGTAVSNEALTYRYDSDKSVFARQSTIALKERRRGASAIALGPNSRDVLLLGGFTDPTQMKASTSFEVLNTDDKSTTLGTSTVTARGNGCAALLTSDKALWVGGRTADVVGGPVHSDGSASIVERNASTNAYTVSAAPALKTPRWAHTCTALQDGTVLVLGGINEGNGSAATVLKDAWIYTPAPPP